jgi:Ca2+-binding EF-hand superfamily protein
MDALAAWQLKKKEKEAERKLAESQDLATPKTTYDDERKLNKLFGFPDPPSHCFCLGKNASAAVWWTYDNALDGIIGWEVHKYRKDNKVWQNKGFIKFEPLSPLQVLIDSLNNGHEYRFTVRAINEKGPGLESPPSNSVYVDSPLPPGWHRFYDRQAERFYFASLKTGRSSWTRPDDDPDFLGDDIYKRFKSKEIQFLRKLYDEDIEHFQCIKADQVTEIIREVGERLYTKKIAYYFNMISGDPTKITTWQQFMQFMVAIKEEKNRKKIKTGPIQFILRCIRRQKLKADLKSSRNKLGAWVIEYNGLLQKHFYRNTETGATSWLIPDEIKFYIPKKLETKLFKIFDPGQIEDMKTYFSELDIDNSGDLSQQEISLLLDAMGIHIDDKELGNLIKIIDINGNGTVEFDEFCWMMFELAKRDRAIIVKQPQRNVTGMISSGQSEIALEGNADNDVSKQQGMTFSGLKRAVSILRKQKDISDDNSHVSFGFDTSPLKRVFSSISQENINSSPVSGSTSRKSILPSMLSSSKIDDEKHMLTSQNSFKKSAKTQPKPDLYKPKPKKNRRKQKSSVSRKIVEQQESESDDSEEDINEGGYAFTKQKSGTFFGFARGSSQKSMDNKSDSHEKDCMCGCRRF